VPSSSVTVPFAETRRYAVGTSVEFVDTTGSGSVAGAELSAGISSFRSVSGILNCGGGVRATTPAKNISVAAVLAKTLSEKARRGDILRRCTLNLKQV
jgi:hypothetical protein